MDYLEKQIKKYNILWNIAAVILVLAVFRLYIFEKFEERGMEKAA